MDFIEKIKAAGVIGAGGAGFPTHVKLDTKAEYILLNGAECEPLLKVDQQLMEKYSDDIIDGFEAARQHIEAKKGIIGIKGKHVEAIDRLKESISKKRLNDVLEIKIIADIYPAGDEQVLVYELTGRIVPEAGLPLNVGCVVINSETVLNLNYALNGKAVTEKYITVAGDIPKKITVKVKVGTPIIDVLKLSGLENFEGYSVIDGGPMMGPVMDSIDGYVTKKNKGFIILKSDHHLIKKKSVTINDVKRINKSACAQCRICTDMCPRFLLGHNIQPHKLMRSLNYQVGDIEGESMAQLCCQCNLCELFSCPMGIYPKTTNTYFKEKLAKEKVRYIPNKETYEVKKSREYRLVSSKKLIARLGLRKYDEKAPLTDMTLTPELIGIALSQHVGAPVQPIVRVGDSVTEGQMIGKTPHNALGANIHSSFAGEVAEINEEVIVVRRK